MRFHEVHLRRDPDCPVCGDAPTIRELQDYEEFCGVGASQHGGSDAGQDPAFDISAVELKQRLDRGDSPVLLDVREPIEFRINRLPGAVQVPLGELPQRLAQLDNTREFVVYCHKGIRSVRAVEFLRGAGFRAFNLRGGINDWIDQVDPTMARY